MNDLVPRPGRICVSGMATMDWSLPDELALYDRIGADRIGLSHAKILDFGRDQAVAEIVRSGRPVGYLVLPVLADPDDESAWERQTGELFSAIEIAAEVGAPTVYFTSGPSGRLGWSEAADRFSRRMAPVVAAAADADIALAVENTQTVRCDLSFTHTVRDSANLADRTGIGLCVDLYCCWQEADLMSTLASVLDRIHLVQVSDFRIGTFTFPNRWVPGDGDLPIDRLLQEVIELGYDGIVDLELTGPEVVRQGAETALSRGVGWIVEQLDA